MRIADGLLPEFDHEMATTRKTLERVPDDRFAWKPHEKSMAMGALASHLANLPSWVSLAIGAESFDMAPGGQAVRSPGCNSRQEVLAMFDKNVADARVALNSATDETIVQPWSLLSNGATILTMPKVAVVRNFVLNHSIHHRAQLGVYLRLNDIPVPSVYGPSADENPF